MKVVTISKYTIINITPNNPGQLRGGNPHKTIPITKPNQVAGN